MLSILLVVLMSGAVLWVVAGEHAKPTSVQPAPGPPPAPVEPPVEPPAPPRPRTPATSRRRPSPASVTVAERSAVLAGRMRGAPLPRHRARSGFLLVLVVLSVGIVVAVVIGALATALAFALRAAVTS